MRPDREAEDTRREGRIQEGLVGEHLLAREGAHDVGRDAHGRQQDDVDLGVSEEPEQVLPEDRISAPVGVVEVV